MSAVVSNGSGGQKVVWVAIGPVGSVDALARVFVFNQGTSSGVIAQASGDGSYRSPAFDGTAGDRIDIFSESAGGERSPTACLSLQDAQPASACQP